MQKELDLPNPRQMEEIILDSIYNGLISGKIDHKLKILQVITLIYIYIYIYNLDRLHLWERCPS